MAKPVKKAASAAKESGIMPFGKKNYLAFVIGLVVIIGGFLFLAAGDTVFAPILLVAGYCVIIPVAILMGDKQEENPKTENG